MRWGGEDGAAGDQPEVPGMGEGGGDGERPDFVFLFLLILLNIFFIQAPTSVGVGLTPLALLVLVPLALVILVSLALVVFLEEGLTGGGIVMYPPVLCLNL